MVWVTSDKRQDTWQLRYLETQPGRIQAADVLQKQAFLLPDHGSALDLACGRGGNALLMAQHGLQVSAWDYAPAAIEQLNAQAEQQSLVVNAQVRDVLVHPPTAESFDVISVSYFLQRELVPTLIDALKPGGMMFYETFTIAKVSEGGPGNPAFRLQPNELLTLFSDLQLLHYSELDVVGDIQQGKRNVAQLVALKSVSKAS